MKKPNKAGEDESSYVARGHLENPWMPLMSKDCFVSIPVIETENRLCWIEIDLAHCGDGAK